ncbi:hypothetical protein K435DRAFT_814451 [Dendrothele bispora CBS 962.96]|uniref:Uncharacterized protein n=1 Tax=Dendrothele bispora (strain CBS 962.96) TaxID=1314807 RepID=A0A4V4HAG1_DENBC|nr:hypothetical protein K435DRAFT_814451 [Dendrothele bispora CBS 962.96]
MYESGEGLEPETGSGIGPDYRIERSDASKGKNRMSNKQTCQLSKAWTSQLVRSVLRELQQDGQLHSDEELQDQAFISVGKYMDKAVQKFGTNLFSYRWRSLRSQHVANDALATF